MKKRLLNVLIFLVTVSLPLYSQTTNLQDSISTSRHNAITTAIEDVSDAVAGINVSAIQTYSMSNDPFFNMFFPELRRQHKVQSVGSGAVISPDGYIVTNYHVVEDAIVGNAGKIVVTLPPGKEYKSELVGHDKVSDIALLKIDVQDAPYIRMGNSDNIILGEWVIALGNPFGLFSVSNRPSVTVGVVSALNMDFGAQRNERVYQDMIQTDASINTGNSGGPLVNAHGELIGINTFIFTGDNYSRGSIGIGFAIPVNRVKTVVEQLKKYGEIDRSYKTGLTVHNISTPMAEYLGLKTNDGVIVSNIKDNSSADKSGFKVGDVIIKVGETRVQSKATISQYIKANFLKAGDTLPFTVIRDGKKINLKLELEKYDR
ncbi:MAG: trypsin-like peptidase domain-containing protein [Candidatus Marinimicrobia bacterium]|nr:trypsin-like peptidase domain-containing protein [Candidatus Neomarinimicrobiota bacterium]